MGFLSDIGGLVSAGVGIYDAFSGGDDRSEDLLKEQESNLAFSRNVAQALANPNSKMFQNLVAQEEDAARTAFAEGIDRLLVEHARAKARGGPGVLMSDRRDEALAQAVGRQRETGTQAAREAARNALTQAASASGIGLTAGTPTIQVAQQVEQAGRDRRAGGWDLITEGLKAGEGILGKALKGFSSRPSTPTGSEVRIG